MPRFQREIRERLNKLNQEITDFSVGGLVEDLKQKFAEYEEVVAHLDAVKKDVIENANSFLSDSSQGEGSNNMLAMLMGGAGSRQQYQTLNRYNVNLLVDHRDSQGAPVIYEDNPTYQNLIGRVEHTRPDGRPDHRLHPDQAGRAAPGQRRLSDPGRAQCAAASRSPGRRSSARCNRTRSRSNRWARCSA